MTFRSIDNDTWCAVKEYYGSSKDLLRSQYVSYYTFNRGIEKRYSIIGKLTYVFDNTLGIQLYGDSLQYYDKVFKAREIADSIVKSMFSTSFYDKHIRFCSNAIMIENDMDYYNPTYYYFDEIPRPPKSIRFHYPIFINDTVFERQIRITIDTTMNVISAEPYIDEISNYDFNIDYNQAHIIADSLGFNKDRLRKDDPSLRFVDGDYQWYFPKTTYNKYENHISEYSGYFIIINARTSEINTEKFEGFIQSCD